MKKTLLKLVYVTGFYSMIGLLIQVLVMIPVIADNSNNQQVKNDTQMAVKTDSNDKKAIDEFEEFMTSSQDRMISGKVTSEEEPEGLPGVNVILKGTTQGTVTDLQ